MARQPPHRYEPGELSRTRRNLGDVPEHEARRLAQLLGGEVGVERTSEQVEAGYERLQELNRRKSDRLISDTAQLPAGEDETIDVTYEDTHSSPVREKTRYRDLVKMNFTAARPEHGVKTLWGAIMSLFTPLMPVKDNVNPRFITKADDIFYRHIENLVISVRNLLAMNRKHPANRLRNRFFARVLNVIKEWDIETLHQELTHLQIIPKNLTFRFCSTLTKLMFEPIMKLVDLEQDYHVAAALKRLYDLCLLSLPERHPDIDKVKRHYQRAVTELDTVFSDVKYQCYPLLMKLSSPVFHPAETFFLEAKEDILRYLGLTKRDVLSPPSPTSPHPEPEAPPAEKEAEDDRILDHGVLQKGLEILERLFPQAGWFSLDSYPDLYAYFQSLFQFPRGAELISRNDPLHQVFVLAHIINELLAGFRSISFGYLWHENGTQLDIGAEVSTMVERWRIVLDEMIGKRYLTALYEYCREIERNPTFEDTWYGEKLGRDLMWMKKQIALPHLMARKGSSSQFDRDVPRLHELSADLCDLLTRIAKDVGQTEGERIDSINNPFEPFSFEFLSPVSQRLKDVLRSYREAPNNANLVLYTFAVVLVLDTLTNNPNSHFYMDAPSVGYRRESTDSSVPQYTVEIVDTESLFREADKRIPATRTGQRHQQSTTDQLTGIPNEAGLRNEIKEEIQRYRRDKIPFVVMTVVVRELDQVVTRDGEEAGVELLKRAADIIAGTVRQYIDTPARLRESMFAVLLPKTVKEEAVSLATRMLAQFSEEDEAAARISIGITQFVQTWGPDKMLRMATHTAEKAAELPPPSFSIYDPVNDTFRTRSDVPP